MTPRQNAHLSSPSPTTATRPSPLASVPSDADRRLAALPSGVLALTPALPDERLVHRTKPFTRQAAGRPHPGRPYLGRNGLVGGWTVDLSEVFANPETLWYLIGFGTNALSINVDLGAAERAIGERLGVAPGRAVVQADSLVFPPMTKGLQPAHGRIAIHRDGRILIEAKENGSVFDRLGTRTLLIPDLGEPEHHPPFDLECGVPTAIQSGAALVPGASSGSLDGSEPSSGLMLRLIWKPFDYSGAIHQPAGQQPCHWSDGPLG